MQDGTYEVRFAAPNRESTNTPSLAATLRVAQDFLRNANLHREDIVFDRVFHQYECGGSTDGSGRLEPKRIIETSVRFTQTIDGIPVVAPGMGTLTVSIDNDLHVTSLIDRTRPVARLAERARMIPSLEGNGFTQGISAEALPTAEDLLQAAWQERMKEWILRGPLPRSFAVVPGSAEVGYAIRGNTAMLVARQEVEVDCGNNFLKRFKVEVPIQP
jgi:hypothetical protein